MKARVRIWLIMSLLLTLLIGAKSVPVREAMFYEKLDGRQVRCNLCPLRCTIAKGKSGTCRVRKNIDGKLYATNYARPVAIHVDPIEKKPLFHFLPGTKILSLATAGCNLRCNFCQNWEISQSAPDELRDRPAQPCEIIELARENDCRSIAFTYTEPTVYYEYMLDIAKLAKEAGLKTVWVSCGYINEEPLKMLLPYLDAANIDLKGFSEDFYTTYTTGSLQPVLRTIIQCAQSGIEMEITNLIIPTANDDPETIREMCRWMIEEVGPEFPLHLSRFFPNYRLMNRPATPVNTLEMAYTIAKEEGLHYVYLGNLQTDKEDTYCPNCGRLLIDRSGYRINRVDIVNGCCKYCDYKIYGRFNAPEE